MEGLLYVSRLARLPVLDPEGARFGHVDDLVLGPPRAGAGPVVIGFVVAVPGRRIFMAAGRVAEIAGEGLRLRTGSLNLRRFAPRPEEALVLHEVLDRQVAGHQEVVNDVGIVPSERVTKSWEVAVVDLVPRRGPLPLPGLRRRAHRIVPWDEVRDVFPRPGGDPHAHLRDLHPVDLAAALARMAPAERLAAARALDDEQLADLLEELPEDDQATLLGGFDLARAADVLEAMDPDDAVDLLAEFGGDRQRELLAAMEPDEAEPLRRLLRYPSDSAGGMMDPEPVLLGPDETVATALAWLRDGDLPAAMAAQVFVVEPPTETPTGRFVGTCSIQRLLREAPGTTLGRCADERPEPIAPTLGEEEVARRLAAYDLVAVPVCDTDGSLLGAVTVDDVLDHVLPEGWRDGSGAGLRDASGAGSRDARDRGGRP